jgi:hypothetical protein
MLKLNGAPSHELIYQNVLRDLHADVGKIDADQVQPLVTWHKIESKVARQFLVWRMQRDLRHSRAAWSNRQATKYAREHSFLLALNEHLSAKVRLVKIKIVPFHPSWALIDVKGDNLTAKDEVRIFLEGKMCEPKCVACNGVAALASQ